MLLEQISNLFGQHHQPLLIRSQAHQWQHLVSTYLYFFCSVILITCSTPDVAGTMAIFLSQANYTPPQLVSYVKRVSSLISEDFTINNTGSFYNENKTVLDNSINTGYKVKDKLGQKTLVNILFSHPNDSTPFWIYGQSLNQASAITTPFTSTLTQTSFLILLFAVTFITL